MIARMVACIVLLAFVLAFRAGVTALVLVLLIAFTIVAFTTVQKT